MLGIALQLLPPIYIQASNTNCFDDAGFGIIEPSLSFFYTTHKPGKI